jgi:hypothetical protein
MTSYFKNKTCLIVSKHQKEIVIAPILNAKLGMKCVSNATIDTDALGTFTGEIERDKSPYDTVKDKCLLGQDLPGVDFIVANEGSFGAHPFIPFITADEEFICLYDVHENEFIVEKMLFYETNFSTVKITNVAELDDVLMKLNFPSHGVILRTENLIIKDLFDLDEIRKCVVEMLFQQGDCNIDTDMRAMHNPTRMKCIEQLTMKFTNTLASTCNQCGWHGFTIVEHKEGLACSLCNRPTKSTLYHLYKCKKCNFEKKKLFPHNKEVEDPTYCDWCNP